MWYCLELLGCDKELHKRVMKKCASQDIIKRWTGWYLSCLNETINQCYHSFTNSSKFLLWKACSPSAGWQAGVDLEGQWSGRVRASCMISLALSHWELCDLLPPALWVQGTSTKWTLSYFHGHNKYHCLTGVLSYLWGWGLLSFQMQLCCWCVCGNRSRQVLAHIYLMSKLNTLANNKVGGNETACVEVMWLQYQSR